MDPAKERNLPQTLLLRHLTEASFFDKAAEKPVRFPYNLGILDQADEYASRALGDLRGKTVIDVGCGIGANAIKLARRGAQVWAFDISSGTVEVARKRVTEAGLAEHVRFDVMAGGDLTYPNSSVDLIFGHSV